MAMMGRPGFPVEWRQVLWSALRAVASIDEAAAVAGVSGRAGRRWFAQRGGMKPPEPTGRSRSLRSEEREEIALLRAAGLGVRQIARAVGRDPGTMSRELRRCSTAKRRATDIETGFAIGHRRPRPTPTRRVDARSPRSCPRT